MVAPAYGSKLNIPSFIIAMLIMIVSFSSWILASINIRRLIQALGHRRYNPIDPNLIVLGILCWLYFLGIEIFGGTDAFKSSMVLVLSTFFMTWYFATAVGYTSKAYDSPRFCSQSVRGISGLSGCHGLYQSLMAVCWVTFILLTFYVTLIYLRVETHAKLPWTSGHISGKDVAVGRLTPPDFRTKEEKAEQGANHSH